MHIQAVLGVHPESVAHSVPGLHSVSGARPGPGIHPVSGGHPVSGAHPLPLTHPASGMHPMSGVQPVMGAHKVPGRDPTQAGPQPAAPSSAPGTIPVCRSPFRQPINSETTTGSMARTKAVHLKNDHSAAASHVAPLVDAKGRSFAAAAVHSFAAAADAADAAQSGSPNGSSNPALVSREQVGVTGFTPAAATFPAASSGAQKAATTAAQIPMNPGTHARTITTGTRQGVALAVGKVGEADTVADSVPEAAAMSSEAKPDANLNAKTNKPEADLVPRGLQATGPSASSLARRAAQSQRALKQPQSPPSTMVLASFLQGSNSFPATTSVPANVQQQRPGSLPSSPLPQQTSALAAAASLQACPGSGQPVKGNPDGQALAGQGNPNRQPVPVPMKGDANGQVSASAAAPVQRTLNEQLTPVKGKARESASGVVAADAATAADPTQVAGSDVASPRALTVAVPSGQAADAEAVAQDKRMNGAASPTTLTKAVPKTQRRQLLQQDSSKRRKQACLVHLKAARLDAIKWLRSRHAVGTFLVIQSLVRL